MSHKLTLGLAKIVWKFPVSKQKFYIVTLAPSVIITKYSQLPLTDILNSGHFDPKTLL